MIRKIVEINREKCNGCGLCAGACHEGAIAMVNGKAKLLRDDYCDGLGDCLPVCPTDAIQIVEREAKVYDEAAVTEKKKQPETSPESGQVQSCLSQWPVQIRLVSPEADCFQKAHLLIAADCTAYAYGNFHEEIMKGRVTLIGCPKLDPVDYREKLALLFQKHAIQSVTVARMEVPCCGGLERAVLGAVQMNKREIPCRIATLSAKGKIVSIRKGEE